MEAWHSVSALMKSVIPGIGVRTTLLLVLMVILISRVPLDEARADNFSSVRYDPQTDEIVARMLYRGSNSNHQFSLQWGTCTEREDGSGKQIAVDVIDNQWNDAALRDYRRTARFSLDDMTCRPARVTLRTPPRFYYTIFVPRASAVVHTAHPSGCRPGYRPRGGSMCVPIIVLRMIHPQSQ
jgi:hypothetical protein